MRTKSIKIVMIRNTLSICAFIVAALMAITVLTLNDSSKTRINYEEAQLHDSFDVLIQGQVEAAISIIDMYNKRVIAGELTLEEAKKMAADIVREIRYGNDGYIWIDNLKGINVVLLGRDVEGTELKLKDSEGNDLVSKFIENGKKDGGGFTSYNFPKSDNDIPMPKRSYSKYYEPFGWIVNTGNYVDDIDTLISQVQQEADQSRLVTIMIMSAASIILLIMSCVLSLLLASRITKPVHRLVAVTESISNGNFNVSVSEIPRNEIGILADNLFASIDAVRSLLEGLNDMAIQHHNGDIDVFIDEAKYGGSFRELACSINQMVKEYIYTNKTAMNCISEIVNGNFDTKIELFPGKKIFINEAIEELRTGLKAIGGEVNSMTEYAVAGNLTYRITADKYKGDWARLMLGLNDVIAAMTEPLNEMQAVLYKMSVGVFDTKMTGNYRGDYDLAKKTVNTMVSNISDYINEISFVLNGIANNNLNQEIKRDYVGEFADIKDSINNITKNLNSILVNINLSAEQVAAGARHLSQSSTLLATGATKQNSSVEKLNSIVSEVNEKTKTNASKANKAKELSKQSSLYSSAGYKEMQRMRVSMDNIKEASNDIAKIIKTIDDIAFQTNLLALNAAVEAARAGELGKGFAVVSGEVRNLAIRSQDAAKETAGLIENSIQKVTEGTAIVNEMSLGLNGIVAAVNEVSSLINDISAASDEQAVAITQINESTHRVSEIVQVNASASEESASASHQLSIQSDTLKNMIQMFKLKH